MPVPSRVLPLVVSVVPILRTFSILPMAPLQQQCNVSAIKLSCKLFIDRCFLPMVAPLVLPVVPLAPVAAELFRFFGHQWQPMAPIAKLPVVPSIWQNTEGSQCCIASETLLVVNTGILETIIFFLFDFKPNKISFFMLCWYLQNPIPVQCPAGGGKVGVEHAHPTSTTL